LNGLADLSHQPTTPLFPGAISISQSPHVHYAFFARHEFTAAAASVAQKHIARLVTLAQLEADMQRWLHIEVSVPG
jgi:hypothetical protein